MISRRPKSRQGDEDFRPLILEAAVATFARLSADASHVAEGRSVACQKNFSDFASVVHEFWTGLLGSSAAVTHTNASRKIAGRHACKWACAFRELGLGDIPDRIRAWDGGVRL